MSETNTIEIGTAFTKEEARKVLALELFRKKRASLSGAARYAGVSLDAWIEIVRAEGLPIIEMDDEDFENDFADLKETRS